MLHGLLGIAIFVLLGWVFSENRRAIRWKVIVAGLFLQFAIAFLLLKAPFLRQALLPFNHLVSSISQASLAGSSFIFGYLGGAELPFAETGQGTSFIIAFRILPIVIVMSALSSLLFYWGILQRLVKVFSILLQKTMPIGGAMGFGVAASIFFGIIETPLLVRPYLAKMNRSELFTLMTACMATISGTVLILYAHVVQMVVPDAVGHMIIASLISAPAAILMGQILIPATEKATDSVLSHEESAHSSLDALAKGTISGVTMVLHIVGVLIVLFATVSLINQGLSLFPEWQGSPLTLQTIAGWFFTPFCWLIGLPWSESALAGKLMGTKTILNEFVAYMDLAQMPVGSFTERSRIILTYALCGFANFGSLGILIGGLGSIVPERLPEIIQLGLRSILAGAAATLITGAVVGLLL